jgi:serine/threonine protein kinase
MQKGRYEQIQELYHAALAQQPETRTAFLQRACNGDETLCHEVESLLAYDEPAARFLEAPPADVANALLAQESKSPAIGQQLSHYRLLSPLGAGGMGEVFLAEDTRLGRKVAIKILSRKFVNDEKLVRRFKQEARAVSALNHPNILTLFDIGEDQSTFFIATEFVKGETLRQRLASGKHPPREAIEIATQVANALAAAHQAGIIHRDIKPENIMLRDDGYVKVLDFGLAKLSEPQTLSKDSSLPTSPMFSTEPGLVMGTTQYMSPEQVRGLAVDARTDIFSLGVVLYEMLSGINPFAGATVSDVIAAILEREPQPLANVSPAIQRLVNKTLKKDKDGRYQSLKAFLDDLKAATNIHKPEPAKSINLPHPDYEPPSVQATRESFVLETQKALAVKSDALPGQQTVLQTSLFNIVKKPKVFLPIFSLLLVLLIAFFAPFSPFKIIKPGEAAKPDTEIKSLTDPTSQKRYWQMTEVEQLDFIQRQSNRISDLLGGRNGKLPLSDQAIRAIKQFVDKYAARTDSLSQEHWKEGLKIVFGRASQYAPVITREFKKQNVPPVLGLYVPMIESEYHDCFENPYGSKGMFQFMPATAQAYGVARKDMCNVEKMAPAAAKYLADRITEFGFDTSSMELVILSFTIGPESIREDLRQLRTQNPNLERSYWTLFDHADELDRWFKNEAKWYVPKFYAAAIVGENPQHFDLGIKPLSEQ